MYGLLHGHQEQAYFRRLLAHTTAFAPYSVLPAMPVFCREYAIPAKLPDTDAVADANSKLYSHRLAVELFDEEHGEIVESAQGLAAAGNRLLAAGSFLVKDDFGVSGKGNLLIESTRTLESVVRYLRRQEDKGKHARFLLEPVLDKELDFSCQMRIAPEGAVEVVCVQQMENAGFAFSAIRAADQALMAHLEQAGYLNRMETIAAKLYREGYFGPVCIDHRCESAATAP